MKTDFKSGLPVLRSTTILSYRKHVIAGMFNTGK